MNAKDWREVIGYGLGGLLVFIIAGYGMVRDIVSFITTNRPLILLPARVHDPGGDMGILFTFVLATLALLGLVSFVFYLVHTIRALRGK